jgi:N-acetylgalactosamine-6-sulfatase
MRIAFEESSMKRHTTTITAFMVLTIGMIAVGRFTSVSRGDGAPRDGVKPNILFIFADDWGWGDLGCHGHPWLKTPNIDRLASEGAEFYQFTVASGVCSPSRTAVMTGHFPARHGVHGHFATIESHAKRGMPDWLDPKAVLLPRLLKESGYATAHFGKWHLTNIMVPDAPLPSEYGYDTYGAFNCSGPQMPVHDDARLAIDFIKRSHAAGKPFLVNLWIHEPHTPHYPRPEYLKQFAHLGDEAKEIYAAVLAHADARIGKVLTELERLDLTDNTLVIFSSDNGPVWYDTDVTRFGHDSSGGLRGMKGDAWENGHRMPFIVRWPGKVRAGSVTDQTICFTDMLATFASVVHTDLPASAGPDSFNILPVWLGKQPEDKAIRGPVVIPSANGTMTILSGPWKLITALGSGGFSKPSRIKPVSGGPVGQLYNLAEDRGETNNLYLQRPATVKRLMAELDQIRDAGRSRD